VEKFQPCDGVLDLWGSAEFKHENTNAKKEAKGAQIHAGKNCRQGGS